MTRSTPPASATLAAPEDVVSFWRAAGPGKWFVRDDAFDAELRRRFGSAQAAAARGDLDHWLAAPQGALALVLLLDQLPRNIHRGTAAAFACDPAARAAAGRAIAAGFDGQVKPLLRPFFYLPFMHSEDLADQERCVALYRASGDAAGLKYALEHRDIIARFGRFPHRNRALGRASTPEEAACLAGGGFTGGQ